MKRQRQVIGMSALTVLLILAAMIFGVNSIWRRVLEFHVSKLSDQIKSTLVRDVSEGNLFEVTATLDRLRMAGLFKEIAVLNSQPGSNQWLYSTSKEFESSLSANCGAPSTQLSVDNNDGLEFKVVLRNDADSVNNLCAFALSEIPADLLNLRKVVILIFLIVATVCTLCLVFLLIRLNRQQMELLKAETAKQLATAEALAVLASQVAHDIRSPLSALKLLSSALSEIPEDKRILIRNSVQRINDIANDLLNRGKSNQKTNSSGPTNGSKLAEGLLAAEVESLVSEKRIQFRDRIGVEISTNAESAYGIFVQIDVKEFKRTLSNLISNSVEAFANRIGRIVVSVKDDGGTVVLTVSDNGSGIPPEVLAKLGERGVTHGKTGAESGSGIGVYHAKQSIELMGGKFVIESVVGKGTSVVMTLPKVSAPKWFAGKLSIKPGTTVVICDDDTAIHGLWKGRLQSINAESSQIGILSFTSGELLKEWFVSLGSKLDLVLFLMDYELLRQPQSGLDLIEELRIGSHSILVTSRYEEAKILERCTQLNVKQIPKGMAGFVPIEIVKPKQNVDAVVLDDEELQKMTWEFAAKQSNRSVVVFKDPRALMDRLADFDVNVPFYIDSNLGNGIKGENIAKELFDLGYTNLYLATGYAAAQFSHLGFLKGIVAKDPVFL